MEINLLESTTERLLEKFGAGNHKPGSGSAAAFQGMLSAKLLVTVISLTNEEKRRDKYKTVLPQLLKMETAIHERIFPNLTSLFHKDAIQFGKTINAREKRDQEKDLFKKNKLGKKALDELRVSTEIPIQIAELCIELAEIAEFVFEKAFQSARGDSQVGFSGSVAGLAGCLSIIQLNLLSFGCDECMWTSKVINQAKELKHRYQELNEIANAKIASLEKEVGDKAILYKEIDTLKNSLKGKSKLKNTDIEKAAYDLQKILWRHRKTLWPNDLPEHPVKLLKPSIVFKKGLGYSFHTTPTDNHPEIAGIIDQKDKIVLISNKYDKNVQNFTAAHELGHALLHKQTVMHRDRPIDGSSTKDYLDPLETQANKFATYFLMPEKLVKQIFKELFLTDKFIINEDTSFSLINTTSTKKLRAKCKNLQGLALKIASTERYNNKSFQSLSKLFSVSPTAMAIRLEELGLVEF